MPQVQNKTLTIVDRRAKVAQMYLRGQSQQDIARVVGFLMSDELKSGTFGTANIGVVIALVLAGVLYLVLTAVTRPRAATRA